MKRMLFSLILLINGANLFSQKPCSQLSGLARLVCLTEEFKGTLSKDQINTLQLEYSKGSAVRWSNFPQAFARPGRVGLSFSSLNAKQLAAAKAIMAEVLIGDKSNEGYDEMEGGLAADDYFGQKTRKTNTFGSGYYVMVFLGEPSTTKLWELMFGGHHFAFANTYDKGKLIGTTPSFRGVEPMEMFTLNGHSYQPLEQERLAMADVIASLSDSEKNIAKTSRSYNDILLGPGEDEQFPTTKSGLRVGDLNKQQQALVVKVIESYVNDLDAATATEWMKKYLAELPDTYISYYGSGTMNQGNDYFRLDGKRLWIEYSAQPSRDFPNTTHPHSVWRDHATDYGGN